MQLINTNSQIHSQPGWCGANSSRASSRKCRSRITSGNEPGIGMVYVSIANKQCDSVTNDHSMT